MQTLTWHDETVLFYIAGYLLRASGRHCSESTRRDISAFAADESETHPVERVDAWLQARNRGGLITPSGQFYQMIKTCELVLRENVDLDHLKKETLACATLRETVLTDTRVQQQWEELSPRENQALLENIVRLFLCLRGSAVAKFVNRQVVTKSVKAKKAGASLRGNMQQ